MRVYRLYICIYLFVSMHVTDIKTTQTENNDRGSHKVMTTRLFSQSNRAICYFR